MGAVGFQTVKRIGRQPSILLRKQVPSQCLVMPRNATLESTTFEQQVCSTKTMGDKQLQKKEREQNTSSTLNRVHQAKISVTLIKTTAGQLT